MEHGTLTENGNRSGYLLISNAQQLFFKALLGNVVGLREVVQRLIGVVVFLLWRNLFGGPSHDPDVLLVTVNGNDEKVISLWRPDDSHVVQDEEAGCQYFDNELILTSGEALSQSAVEEAIAPFGAKVAGRNEYTKTYQIVFDDTYTHVDLLAVASSLEGALPGASAMPDYIVTLQPDVYPDDSEWSEDWDDTVGGKNWGMEAIHAPEMWDEYYSADADPISIGVLDNQFFVGHEDLDFQEVFLNELDGHADKEYHGTHVAGIVAAVHDNSKGVAGVFPKAKLYGVSALGLSVMDVREDVCGVPISYVEAGLSYLLAARGCKVVNCSFKVDLARDEDGTVDLAQQKSVAHFEESLRTLIDDGYDFVITKASGNDRVEYDGINYFNLIRDQEVLDRIITVGSAELVEGGYRVWAHSNYGSGVDLIAPGTDIYSCSFKDISPFAGLRLSWGWFQSRYEVRSGTSMAAPHVAGVTGVIWSANPSLTGPEVKEIICSTATGDYGYSEGIAYRYPMLDGYRAIQEALSSERRPDGEKGASDEMGGSTEASDPTPARDDSKGNAGTDEAFTIVGSWRSVGSVGFGQAQPGATVTFTEDRCNFYSPSDTYRIYESGGALKLDCTNILWKDTLTFTVKVLDADHITIDTGSSTTTTELERITSEAGSGSGGNATYIDGMYANFDLPLILVYDFYDDGIMYACWADEDGNFLSKTEGTYDIHNGIMTMYVDLDAAARSVGLDPGVVLGSMTGQSVTCELDGDTLYLDGVAFYLVDEG